MQMDGRSVAFGHVAGMIGGDELIRDALQTKSVRAAHDIATDKAEMTLHLPVWMLEHVQFSGAAHQSNAVGTPYCRRIHRGSEKIAAQNTMAIRAHDRATCRYHLHRPTATNELVGGFVIHAADSSR